MPNNNAIIKKIKKFRAEKPRFIRLESWRYNRVKEGSWRKSKGIDSKMRLKEKGRPISPSPGFRSPGSIRGLHPSGLSELLVYRVEDLVDVNPETHAIRIGSNVGRRKYTEIRNKAIEFKLTVLNPSRTTKTTGVVKGDVEQSKQQAEQKRGEPSS